MSVLAHFRCDVSTRTCKRISQRTQSLFLASMDPSKSPTSVGIEKQSNSLLQLQKQSLLYHVKHGLRQQI